MACTKEYYKLGGVHEIMIRKKGLSIVIFLLSFISLFISVRLFWNMGLFVDEYNLSPDAVNGGEFWVLMDWLRLVLLFLLCVVSGLSIFSNKQSN